MEILREMLSLYEDENKKIEQTTVCDDNEKTVLKSYT